MNRESLEENNSAVGGSKSTSTKSKSNLLDVDSSLKLSIFASVGILLSFGPLFYGFISYSRPELIDVAIENKAGLISLVIGFLTILIMASIGVSRGLQGSFMQIDKKFRLSKKNDNPFAFGNLLGLVGADVLRALLGSDKDSGVQAQSGGDGKALPSIADQLKFHGTAFEQYLAIALIDLQRHVDLTEEKASNVLDKGIFLMVSGIIFYVFSIAMWQFVANFASPNSYVMYLGMGACSMTFLVIEFLAAWFFKQYRFYVNASMSCMKVKSDYDRILMTYYIVKEFGDDNSLARDSKVEMLAALSHEIKWPEHGRGASADLDHMVEMFGSVNMTLEKMRGIFAGSEKKSNNSGS